MAIYHLSVKVGTRKDGQSAVAKCNYIARQDKYGKSKDRDNVVHIKSGNMPEWATEGRGSLRGLGYWRAADQHERANGVLFREIEFALPRELSQDQNIELAGRFAEAVCQRGGSGSGRLPYTLAIHQGRNDNPHCHLVISERINDGHARAPESWFKRAAVKTKPVESGGARKANIGQQRKAWLLDTRKLWADMANEALDGLGGLRIDHRSYADQKVDAVPGLHIGPAVLSMADKGINTSRAESIAAYGRNNEDPLPADREASQRKHGGDSWLGRAVSEQQQAANSAERAVAEVGGAAASVARARESRHGWRAVFEGIGRVARWARARTANVLEALGSAETASDAASRVFSGVTHAPRI